MNKLVRSLRVEPGKDADLAKRDPGSRLGLGASRPESKS